MIRFVTGEPSLDETRERVAGQDREGEPTRCCTLRGRVTVRGRPPGAALSDCGSESGPTVTGPGGPGQPQ
eukprot:676306-Hanusia_phi.AAC.1